MKLASLLLRSFSIVVTTALLSPLTTWCQPSNCVPSPPGLISWWRAEGNANDAADGNNGILDGSMSFVTGRVGQAFSFNGINADVRVTASANLNVGAGDGFTLETWINPASVAEQRPLVEWNNGAYGVNLWLQDPASGGSGLGFNITDTSLQDHVLGTAAGSITIGYQHVAATYNKTDGMAVLYINGALAAQGNVGTFTPRTIGDLYFGLRPAGPGAGFRFQGGVDEVSLYGRALSAAEVQAIYQAGSLGKCTGTSAPVIIAQPTNQTVAVGANATFALAALGTAPLAYQWLFNGTNIVGAAEAMLVIANVQSSNAGSYSAFVTNQYGAATSTVATLTIGTSQLLLFDAAMAFSTNNNPNGVWSYGYSTTLGGVMTLHNTRGFNGGIEDWHTDIWLNQPSVMHNSTGTTLTNSTGSIVLGPGQLAFHPGPNGEFCLIRFTAPSNGWYEVSGAFNGSDTHGTTTDAHIFVNGAAVTSGLVNGYGPGSGFPFDFNVELDGGDQVDFAVGRGANNEFSYDSTGLLATVRTGNFQPLCVPPPPGLVSWWPGNVNADDIMGTNNGTFVNGAVYGAGKVGQAFSFDGGSRNVRIPASASLDVGKGNGLTIEAWINPATSGQQPILEWAPGGGDYGAMVWINAQSSGSVYADLFDSASTDHLIQTAAGVITNNGFQHVAVTYNKVSGLARIMVNGVLVKESTLGSFTVGTSADLYIGYRPPTSPFGPIAFNGLIDEVSLYSRALSISEIQAIYQAGSFGKCTGPTPPALTAQPVNQTVVVGDTAMFVSSALGTLPLSYQWRQNGMNISGATNATLVLPNVQFTNAGSYSVVVTNLYGSATSSNAVLTVISSPVCTAPPAGLISWWRAEASTLDSAGNNHGVVIGNAAYGSGRVGAAFVFDGNGDAVLLGTPANLQLQNFTVEAWIKRSSLSVVSLDFNGGTILGWGFGGSIFGLKDDGTLFLSQVGISEVNWPGAVTDANWHHVAVTKNGSTVAFYLDGTAHPVAAYDPNFTFGPSLAIGARGDTLANSFLGSIDELSVYGRALSTGEIQAIYNAGVSGKCVVPIPPSIVTHPQNATVLAGANTTFSVVAGGSVPLSYQWRFNGTNLPNATSSTLQLNNVQLASAGSYSVVVTNMAGAATSSNALLTITLPTPVVRIGSTNVMAGAQFTLPITLAANGNENALGFSFTYSTQRFSLVSVELGSGAPGATMLVNSSLVWTGRVGIALAYPPQSAFAAGTQEVARLTFYALPSVSRPPPTTIVMGDQPVLRELLNSQLQSMTAIFNNGTVALDPTVFESDVSPRPNGNQAVSTADWLQISRFVARLDAPTSSAEFQRADSASRATLGDGQLKVTDWVQAGRNLGGLDPLLAIGGPANEGAPVLAGPSANRLLRILSTNVRQGETTTVSVVLDAQGDETAIGFTIGYDPAALDFAGVALGADAASATLQPNLDQTGAGRLGLALALPTDSTFTPGTREILRVTFDTSAAAAGAFPIALNDQIVTRCVSDIFAGELPVSFVNGTLTVDPLVTSPLISIAQSGTNVVLTWPLAAADFTLQSLASANGLTGSWSNTPALLQTNGDTVIVTLPLTNQSRFFRLVYP